MSSVFASAFNPAANNATTTATRNLARCFIATTEWEYPRQYTPDCGFDLVGGLAELHFRVASRRRGQASTDISLRDLRDFVVTARLSKARTPSAERDASLLPHTRPRCG